MKSVLHKSENRRTMKNDWLLARQSFSFGGYYDPEKMGFGMLRVLNDDDITGGKGFGTHPHSNMEIISLGLEGELKHEDSMGHQAILKPGSVQIISAGTGIFHSEVNNQESINCKLLQIWLYPNQKNVTPRYDQKDIDQSNTENQFFEILSPNKNNESVWVHQDAWFHLGSFNYEQNVTYNLKKNGNGIYIFVIEGNVTVNDQQINSRDALGVWETEQIELQISKNSKVLLIDIPMS